MCFLGFANASSLDGAGYIYAVLLFVAPFLQTVFVNQYFYLTFNTGMQVRAAIVTAVYKKSLRLSPSSRNKKTQGEIVNMQSNDPQRLQDLCPNFHLLWSAPLQIISISPPPPFSPMRLMSTLSIPCPPHHDTWHVGPCRSWSDDHPRPRPGLYRVAFGTSAPRSAR